MDAATTQTPLQAYARDLGRRVATVVGTLRSRIWNGFVNHPGLGDLAEPLFHRINRGLRRFRVLMALFAAGLLRPRRGPHTGGAPHPENLLHGNPFPYNWLIANFGHDVALCGIELKRMLAEPEAVEVLARVPAAARALRPILRLLGEVPDPRREGREARLEALARATYANVGIADPAPRGAKVPRPSPPIRPQRAETDREKLDRLVAWWVSLHPPEKKPP